MGVNCGYWLWLIYIIGLIVVLDVSVLLRVDLYIKWLLCSSRLIDGEGLTKTLYLIWSSSTNECGLLA